MYQQTGWLGSVINKKCFSSKSAFISLIKWWKKIIKDDKTKISGKAQKKHRIRYWAVMQQYTSEIIRQTPIFCDIDKVWSVLPALELLPINWSTHFYFEITGSLSWRYIFLPGLLLLLFSLVCSFMVVWGLGFWGWGLGLGFWGWGFQLVRFEACCAVPSGFSGLGLCRQT